MRRKVILIIISILILTLSILGITYAFMKPQVEEKEEKSNITINACAKIQLKDNGSSINLENTYPMDNDMGLKTKPYEFTVASTCEDYIGFNLYLTSLTDNEIEDNNIHFAITSQENIVLVSDLLSKTTDGLKDFNTNELKELDIGIKGSHKNIYKVYSNNIPLKGESNYKLYLWLDKDASNDTMGKSFKVGLSIKSFNREETMAEYLIKNKNETLIYHDGLPDFKGMENSELEAEDLSYRFSGSNTNVKNYACLDSKTTGACESDADLYRIIGLFKNDTGYYEIKLIKANVGTTTELGDNETAPGGANLSETTYHWNSSNSSNSTNMWQYSNLNTENLNKYFYDYITEKAIYLKNHITEHIWITGGYSTTGDAKTTYDNELGKNKVKVNDNACYSHDNQNTTKGCTIDDIEHKAHIGLMYISDYMYGAISKSWSTVSDEYNTVTSYNWLYIGSTEWTISRFSSYGQNARGVSNTGFAYYAGVSGNYEIRPCFYLTHDAKFKEGEGSKETPYRITFE